MEIQCQHLYFQKYASWQRFGTSHIYIVTLGFKALNLAGAFICIPSLSMEAVNTLTRLGRCAGSSEPWLLIDVINI